MPRVSPSLLRAERGLCRGDLGRLSAFATLTGVAADIEQAEVSQLGYPLPLGFPLVAIVGHLIEDDPGRVMLLKPRGQLGVAGPEPLSAAGIKGSIDYLRRVHRHDLSGVRRRLDGSMDGGGVLVLGGREAGEDLIQLELAELLGSMPRNNITEMFAHATSLTTPFLRLAQAQFTALELSVRQRELVILAVAGLVDCEYEYAQHMPVSAAAGIPPALRERIRNGDFTAPDDPAEQAPLAFVLAVVEGTASRR